MYFRSFETKVVSYIEIKTRKVTVNSCLNWSNSGYS